MLYFVPYHCNSKLTQKYGTQRKSTHVETKMMFSVANFAFLCNYIEGTVALHNESDLNTFEINDLTLGCMYQHNTYKTDTDMGIHLF